MNQKERINKAFEKYFLEENSVENRKRMKDEFEAIVEFPLEDKTTMEMVDEGIFCFKGLNPKTNRNLVIKLEKTKCAG